VSKSKTAQMTFNHVHKHISWIATVVAVAGAAAVMLAEVAPAAAGGAGSGLPTLRLGVTPRSVTVSGALQSGAVKVVTTVSGEGHSEPVLVRMNPGVPFSAFAQAVAVVNAHGGDLNYVDPYGSIVFDVSANAGTSSTQTALQPGNYVAIDLSKGASPPHTTFTISRADHPAALPKPGATIAAIEFGFRGSTRLHDGEVVRFRNSGFLVHQIQGIGVKSAEAARQLTALLQAGKDRRAQKLGISFPEFAGPISTGASQQELINEKPGAYVLVCIMRTQDGREHTQLGMVRTIQIVR
jgi:hypothetical protein